eukprot:534517-Prymnesium_polylepis.1
MGSRGNNTHRRASGASPASIGATRATATVCGARVDRRVLVAADAANRWGGPQGSGEPGASQQP